MNLENTLITIIFLVIFASITTNPHIRIQ